MLESKALAGDFIISEANGHRSREAITVLSGQNLEAGAVLGKVSQAGSATAVPKVGNTGNGAMGAITLGNGAKVGTYVLTLIAAGATAAFQVEDPDGVNIGNGAVGSAFAEGGLSFTLADGAVDFANGDQIYISVTGDQFKWKAYDPDASDGSQVPAGILFAGVDATAADKKGAAIVRDAEVNSQMLIWDADTTADEKENAINLLAGMNIHVRT